MRALRFAAITTIGFGAAVASADRAHVTAEVYGDGAPATVTLSDAGDVTITSAAHGAQVVHVTTAPVHGGTLTVGAVHGVPAIEVVLDDKLAIVLTFDGAWHELARSPVGGGGLDVDYGTALALEPVGLVRYQTRGDLTRCDGKPPLAFAEGWDGHAFRRMVPPDDVDANAAHVTAVLDPAPPPLPPLLYQARAASSEPDAGDAGALGIPHELDDGKLETAWRHADGRGQFFTFVPRIGGVRAAQLRIVPGAPRAADAARVRRPARVAVVSAHGAWWIELPDGRGAPRDAAYVAELPAIDGCVTVVLEHDATHGAGDVAIAELEIYATGERAGGGDAVLAHAIAIDATGATTAAATLAHRGAAGVAAIDAELTAATTAPARRQLVRALIAITDPAAAPVLARAVTAGWVGGVDLATAIAALGALGEVDALHALAGRGTLELDARIAAAAAIHATTPAAIAALVELAGHGPRELRHQVIASLATGSIAALVDATAQPTTPATIGDLWRAITRRAHGSTAAPAERAAAIAAMLAALPAAADYERRYRLVEGLATLGDVGALATLQTFLHGLGAGAEASALREVAARAAATAPRPDAMPLLLALAGDASPGVRLDALAALAYSNDGDPTSAWHTTSGRDGIDRVIITALATDTWPEIRRRAATALGARCIRTTGGDERAMATAALDAAIGKDAVTLVRVDALDALLACQAPELPARLAAIWNDGKAPLDLRVHAVDLAATLGDPRVGATMMKQLAAWRGGALDNAEALALAQHAAVAVGRLAPPGAAAALIDALGDSAYPEIVASAAAGLEALGPACPPAAKAQLAQLATSDERQIAVPARHAAAVCGRARE